MTQQKISTPSVIDVRDEIILSLNSYAGLGIAARDPWNTVLTTLSSYALDPTTIVPAMDSAASPSATNPFLTASHLANDLFNAKVCKVISTSSADNADYFGTDHTPFQQALLAMPTGGNIIVLPGTYTFTASLTVSIAGIRIIGAHPNTVTIVGGDFPVFTFTATDQTLERLTVYGVGAVSTPSLMVTGERNTITMVNFENFNLAGLALNGARHIVRFCKFESTTGQALFLQGTQQQAISCSFNGTIPDGCVTVEGSACGILGCFFESSLLGYAYNIASDGVADTRLVANHFDSPAAIVASQDNGSASVRYANTPYDTNVNNILENLQEYTGQPELASRSVTLGSSFTTTADELTSVISDLDLFIQHIYEERNFFLTSDDPTFIATGAPISGHFSWDGTTLTWPDFQVRSVLNSATAWTVAAGTTTVASGQAVMVTLNRATPSAVTPVVTTQPITLDNANPHNFVLAFSPAASTLIWAESGRPLGLLGAFDIQGYPLPIAQFVGVDDPRNPASPFSGFSGATNSNLTDKFAAQSKHLKTLVENTNIVYEASADASITSTVTVSSYYGAGLLTGLNGNQPTHYVSVEGSTYCLITTGSDAGLYRFHRDAPAWYKIPYGPSPDFTALASVNTGVGVLTANGGVAIYTPSTDTWEFRTPVVSSAISLPFTTTRASSFRSTGQADYSIQTEDYSLFRTCDDNTIVYSYRDNTLTQTLTPVATDLPCPLGFVTNHYKDTGYTVTLDPDTLYSHSLSNGYSEVTGLPPDSAEGRIVLNPELISGLAGVKWEALTIENFSYEPISTQIVAVYTDGSGTYYLFRGALNTEVRLEKKITPSDFSTLSFTPSFWLLDAVSQSAFIFGFGATNEFTAITCTTDTLAIEYQDAANTCKSARACLDTTGIIYVLSSVSGAAPILYQRSVTGTWTQTSSGSSILDDITSWFGTGTINNTMLSLATIGTDVYVGGIDGGGGPATKGIAKWDSITSTASPLGTGTDGAVFALAVNGTDLYVGGEFTTAGGFPANCVAKWNTLTSTWSSLGLGCNGRVYALSMVGTDLYVGGVFTTAGGISANYVAKCDTLTSAWSSLGLGCNNRVLALTSIGTDIYAGGYFTTAGSSTANHIAKWDVLTSSWSALSNGVDSVVNGMAAVNTDLYVGGYFTTAGSSTVDYLAKWNTTTSSWSSLGGLDSYVNTVYALGTDVYIGGAFATVGSTSAANFAKFNTTTSSWSAFGGGPTFEVNSITSCNGIMYVAGGAPYFSRWLTYPAAAYGVAGKRYVMFLGQDTLVGRVGAPTVWVWDKVLNSGSVIYVAIGDVSSGCQHLYGAVYDPSTQTFHWFAKSRNAGRVTHFCYAEYASQFSFVTQLAGTDLTTLADLPTRSANSVGILYPSPTFSVSSSTVSGTVYCQTTDRGLITAPFTLSTSTWLRTAGSASLVNRKPFNYGTSAFSQYPQHSFYPLGALADTSTRMDLGIRVGHYNATLPGSSASLYGGVKTSTLSDRNAPLFVDPGVKVRNIASGTWFGINRTTGSSGMLWCWMGSSPYLRPDRECEFKRLAADRGDITVANLYPVTDYDVAAATGDVQNRHGVVYKNTDPTNLNKLAFLLINPTTNTYTLEYPQTLAGAPLTDLTSEPKIIYTTSSTFSGWHVVSTTLVGGVDRLIYWSRPRDTVSWSVETTTTVNGRNPCKPIVDPTTTYIQVAVEGTSLIEPKMWRKNIGSSGSVIVLTSSLKQFASPVLARNISGTKWWLFGSGVSAGVMTSDTGNSNTWTMTSPLYSYESLVTSPAITTSGSNDVVVAGSTGASVGVWKFTPTGYLASGFSATPLLETASGEEEYGYTGFSFTYDGKLLYSATRPARTKPHWSMRISYNNWDSLGESLLGPARCITVGYDHFRECWANDPQDLITWLKLDGLQSQRWSSLPVSTYKDNEFLALRWSFSADVSPLYLFAHGVSPALQDETLLPAAQLTSCSSRRWPLILGTTANKGGSGANVVGWGGMFGLYPPVGVSNLTYFGTDLTGAGNVVKALTQGALLFNGTHHWKSANSSPRTATLIDQSVVLDDTTPDKSVLYFEFLESPLVLRDRPSVTWATLNYPTDRILFELLDYQSGKFLFRHKALGGDEYGGHNWLDAAWKEPREFTSFMDARWLWPVGRMTRGVGNKKVFNVTPLAAQVVKIKEVSSLHGIQSFSSGHLVFRTDLSEGELLALINSSTTVGYSKNAQEGITVVVGIVNGVTFWPEDFATL